MYGWRRAQPAAGLGVVIAGLVATLAGLWLVSLLLVAGGAPWERALDLWLHGVAGGPGTAAANAVSWFGYADPIVPILAVCAIWWLARRAAWKAGALLLSFAMLTALDYGAKPLFHRPRPELWAHVQPAGFSFPSGHALFAVGFYGMIAALGLRGAGPGARRWGWTLWALFAAAIGVSRLVLGVHWPTDVLAGWAGGAVVLWSIHAALRRWRPQASGR